MTARLAEELRGVVGPRGVIEAPAERATYASDGLTSHRVVPGIVVLPETTAQVQGVVRACRRARVPFVARGAGTGLSGGALPVAGGVLIVLSRMRRIREIDLANQRIVVEPGVANLDVTKAVAGFGYRYAPDPSSQVVCSVGGNVAENAGGAHCLKHGFTTNHVTGLEVVLPDGAAVRLGGKGPLPPGYDLVGAFVGSEGTLGVVTEVTLRIIRVPEAVGTLLAAFESTDAAGDAVSAIVAGGVLPAAIEMMDALALEAAEAAVHPGYPPGRAVLIVEADGCAAAVDEELADTERHCLANGATALRVAADEADRARMWLGRKSAFAAVGRISPDYYVQDGVVPRTELPAVLREIGELGAAHGLRVANVFHAGDGNLHPLVLYDAAVAGQAERAERLAGEILAACLRHGGSITGEHGVGVDKRRQLGEMFTADDLAVMQLLRCAFDPGGLCNPGKVFPTPRLCGEVPGPHRAHPLERAGVAARL